MPEIEYTNTQINSLIKGIYDGAFTPEHLPKNLYKATSELLNQGVSKGFGGFEFGTPDHDLINELKTNIYIFSGAKTFTQVQHLSSLLTKGNDHTTFADFKKEALSVYKTYNEAYLESEYVTAMTSATNAKQWNEAWEDRELFTQLRYTAILDSHTSEICKRLNGVTLSTTDKFWHDHTPPNHFNCRCFIEKLDKFDQEPKTPTYKIKEIGAFVDEKTQPLFKMNSGREKIVFKKDHPYFDIEPKYRKLAKKNFNLPIPVMD